MGIISISIFKILLDILVNFKEIEKLITQKP